MLFRSRAENARYFFFARRWKRVLFSIFLCFFLRMRLRRFLISDPMRDERLANPNRARRNRPKPAETRVVAQVDLGEP